MSIKPFSLKTLLFLSPSSRFPYSVFVSHFCSSPTPPSRLHSSRRHPEEETRNVKVSVWWDFENCNLPAGVNVFKVAQTITAAIRANGIKGPVQITAFGDVLQLSRANQEALSLTGINLTHIPNGGKNSADRFLLVDLMHWVSQNPPPAHLFLISSDSDYAAVLHRLRMNNYNILLASNKDTTPSVLCSAASIMWHWNALVRGDSLTGKVFNQPPDGPYGSWYGHYKVPLEDPFSVEQPTCSTDESMRATSEAKVRPIPKSVMKQILDVLSLYPKGIPISNFRAELAKRNVSLDKDFYGYKKFTPFLLSMRNILRLQSNGDVMPVTRGVGVKLEPSKPNSCIPTGSVMSDASLCHSKSMRPDDKETLVNESLGKEPLTFSSLYTGAEESASQVQECSASVDKATKMDIEKHREKVGVPDLVDEKVVEVGNALVSEDNLSFRKGLESKTKEGFLKKIWRRWSDSGDDKSHSSGDNSKKKCDKSLDKFGPSVDSFEKKKVDKEIVEPSNQGSGSASHTSCSLSNSESSLEVHSFMSSQPHSEKTERSSHLFNRIMQWCMFWGYSPSSILPGDEPNVKQMNNFSGKHEIFCDDAFWRDMDAFFDSHTGSLVVSQSKTREEMASNVQKDGPSVLRSLNGCNALQLVDVLISEKKWIEEHPSEASPFKLIRSAGQNTSLSDSHTSNSLRSIFVGSSVQSNPKTQAECDGDGKHGRIRNISDAGVSKPARRKKNSERSRSETLMDCQKLVDEILKEFPEGYDIGSFRKRFFERYGYLLDIGKLGYGKLASLIEVMPGAKVESRYIIPSSKTPKESGVHDIEESNTIHSSAILGSDSSDASKSDESDSTWEELGPLDYTSISGKAPGKKCSVSHYEPCCSDDDEFSDSGVTSLATQLGWQSKSEMKSEDSSLIQILDSWYSSDVGVKRQNKGVTNCSENGLQPSDRSGICAKTGSFVDKYYQKQKSQKSYSFVAEFDVGHSDGNQSAVNSAEKLIEGVLGNLRKSGGSGMKS